MAQVKLLLVLIAHLIGSNRMLALHDLSSENRVSSAAQYCTDLNPQNGLDVDQIMGLWYGSEVITHLGMEEGVTIYDTCVVIHLADVTNSTPTSEDPFRDQSPEIRFGTSYGYPGDRSTTGRYGSEGGRRYQHQQQQQQQYHLRQQQLAQQLSTRYLRLIWDENSHTLEYTLRYNNSRPGFWISSMPQSGSMVQLSYEQFTGTVQVLKAISNQLVLTFCQTVPGGQLFSIVLSRQPMGLSLEENQSIRNLLKRRNLPTAAVRKVCYKGAASFTSISGSLLLAAMLLVRLVSM